MHLQDTSTGGIPPVLLTSESDVGETCGGSDCCGESGASSRRPLTAAEAARRIRDAFGPGSTSLKPSQRLQERAGSVFARIANPSLAADGEPERKSDGEPSAASPSNVHTGAQVVESSQSLVGTVVAEISGLEAEKYVVDGVVQARIDDIQMRRERSLRIAAEFDRRGDDKAAERLRACGCDVWLRRWVETGNVDLLRVDWCQKRIVCANCEKARTARTLASWVPKILEVMIHNPDLLPVMVTLTVKNGEALLERSQHCLESLGRLRRRKKDSNRGKGAESQFDLIAGAVWHLEVKRGAGSGLWHPHLHGLCLRVRDQSFDLDAMREEWNVATRGDSHHLNATVTDFGREMLRTGADALTVHEANPGTLVKDLCEILKYCLKPDPGMAAADVVDAYYALYGKRLVRPWGVLYGFKVEDAASDAPSSYGAYVDHIYRFMENNEPRLNVVRSGYCGADVLSHAEARPRFVDLRWPCTTCGTFEGVEFVDRTQRSARYLCKGCRNT